MTDSDHDDVQSHLLSPEESLDDDQTGVDPDEGYSPPERPLELRAWGVSSGEVSIHESLSRRLARELPDVTDRRDGDGIGDREDGDGEPLDRQVGNRRAGRLIAEALDPRDGGSDFRAHDVGIDGGAATAEEAAIHIVDDDSYLDLDEPEWQPS